MMTEVRLPSWWIHHLCIVELWVIWIAGDIRKMGTGRIIENGGLCEVVRVNLRVALHIHDQMMCTLAIVWIAVGGILTYPLNSSNFHELTSKLDYLYHVGNSHLNF